MPDFSPTAWLVIGVLIAAELALLLTALVLLVRTPAIRLTLPRVIWVLLCLIQFIGPIAFFVAGRRPAGIAEEERVSAGDDRVQTAIDELYG